MSFGSLIALTFLEIGIFGHFPISPDGELSFDTQHDYNRAWSLLPLFWNPEMG